MSPVPCGSMVTFAFVPFEVISFVINEVAVKPPATITPPVPLPIVLNHCL